MKKVTGKRKMFQVFLFIVSIGAILLSGCSSSTTTSQNMPTSTYTPPTYATVTSGKTTVSTTASESLQASVSVVSTVQNVKPGETFDVFVRVDSTIPTRGLQCTLKWDPDKAECASVEIGSYYQTVASEYGGDLMVLPASPKPDNTIGQFPSGVDPIYKTSNAVAVAIAGAIGEDGTLLGPTGDGTVFVLHMVAKSGSAGQLNFDLSNVILKDNSKPSISLETTVSGAQITVAAG